MSTRSSGARLDPALRAGDVGRGRGRLAIRAGQLLLAACVSLWSVVAIAETADRSESAGILTGEGYDLLDVGRAEEAAGRFEAALREDPRSATALEGLAWARYELGDFGRAAGAADARLALDPADPGWRQSWVTIVAADPGRRGEAVAAARVLAEERPRDATVRDLLGRVLVEAGRSDEAAAEFEAALREDPRDLEALRALAEIARWDQDLDAARRFLERAAALRPADAQLQAELRGVGREIARLRAARFGPTLPLVFGVIGASVLIGSSSRRPDARAFAALAVCITLLTGLAFAWLRLIPLN